MRRCQWLDVVGITVTDQWRRVLGGMVAASGLAGVACSTMIYASTRRPFWNAGYTAVKFLLTCAVLGIPMALCMRLGVAALASGIGDRVKRPERIGAFAVRMAGWRRLPQNC